MDLGVIVDSKLNLIQQYTFLVMNANHLLGCIAKCGVSESREAIIPLYLEFLWLHLCPVLVTTLRERQSDKSSTGPQK